MVKDKTTVCDVIKYEEDIELYPLIKIYAGVGSGKSHLASCMITGSEEYGIPEQNVLLITSRSAKVEETLRELGVSVKRNITKNGNLSSETYYMDEDEADYLYGKHAKKIKITTDMGDYEYLTYNKSVVCTNAYIAAYLRYVYDPDDPVTHIWNKFDAIVIDEVHSLVTDSTYQSATFSVLSLIQEYLNRFKNGELQDCACKHLILMTGTPQPFEAAINIDFPEEWTHKLELFDKCENVVPKNVILIDSLTTISRIGELLSTGEKVIYFTNHTLSEGEARKKFGVPDTTKIGVSFSSDAKRKKLTKEEQERISKINTDIADNSLIPEDIQLFVTTSRNKEGININNEDYHNMFVETHLMYDAVQMAGRVRSGVENLYIIVNAEQLNSGSSTTDIIFSKKVMVANEETADSRDEANQYLAEYLKSIQEKSKEDKKALLIHYVKYIEDRFAYVRYDVFKQTFEFFKVKEQAETIAQNLINGFKNMVASDNNKLVERWFSKSTVKRELSAKEQCTAYLMSVIGNQPFVRLKKEELRAHCQVVRDIFKSNLTSPKPILHLVDSKFNCIESGKTYILYYVDKDPRIKKMSMAVKPKH